METFDDTEILVSEIGQASDQIEIQIIVVESRDGERESESAASIEFQNKL
jgi:hypothetical protein